MQFYLISPALLVPLSRWPRFGLGLLAVLFTCSVSITAALTALNDYPAMPIIAGNV
jgi:peptidoglycan/LPS O-acetylase OafA/YrhL